jgi:hypothetical protein
MHVELATGLDDHCDRLSEVHVSLLEGCALPISRGQFLSIGDTATFSKLEVDWPRQGWASPLSLRASPGHDCVIPKLRSLRS